MSERLRAFLHTSRMRWFHSRHACLAIVTGTATQRVLCAMRAFRSLACVDWGEHCSRSSSCKPLRPDLVTVSSILLSIKMCVLSVCLLLVVVAARLPFCASYARGTRHCADRNLARCPG